VHPFFRCGSGAGTIARGWPVKALSLGEMATLAGGRLVNGDAGRNVVRVVTDSRAVQPGDFFVALRGEKFDGHDFVMQAALRGAIAALVDEAYQVAVPAEAPALILVPDTLKGLQTLAANYRKKMPTKILAVTGSNGKTTVKEMAAAILATRYRTHKTTGNLNNHIGVPLTLLGIEPDHEWAVVEMGMNHPGELAPLAEMSAAEVGLISSVGWAHIEAFADRAGIAEEKTAVIRHLSPGGLAVLNGDNEFLRQAAERCVVRKIFVGASEDCAYRIKSVLSKEESCEFVLTGPSQEMQIRIPLPGWHMAQNAALAAVFGLEIGLSIAEVKRGLESMSLMKNRLSVRKFRSGFLIDDTYNANPDSMKAGFETLRSLPGTGRNVALLGSMGELGSRSTELHQWTGKAAADEGTGLLLACGPMAEELVRGACAGGLTRENTGVFADHESLAESYWSRSRVDDRILVKGSRSQVMERVVEILQTKERTCCTS